MRYAYREIGGKIQAVLVSDKTRFPDKNNELYGDDVPFHRRMLNAYSDLEQTGQLTGPLTRSRNKSYVRDVHSQALEEGI